MFDFNGYSSKILQSKVARYYENCYYYMTDDFSNHKQMLDTQVNEIFLLNWDKNVINMYRNSNKCYKELSHFVQAAASSRWFRQAELVIAFFFFITFSSNVIYLQVYILRSQKTKRDLLPDHAQITHNGFKSYLISNSPDGFTNFL